MLVCILYISYFIPSSSCFFFNACSSVYVSACVYPFLPSFAILFCTFLCFSSFILLLFCICPLTLPTSFLIYSFLTFVLFLTFFHLFFCQFVSYHILSFFLCVFSVLFLFFSFFVCSGLSRDDEVQNRAFANQKYSNRTKKPYNSTENTGCILYIHEEVCAPEDEVPPRSQAPYEGLRVANSTLGLS